MELGNTMIVDLLKCYEPLFHWKYRYIQLIGGYGSGKSFHAIVFMLLKMLNHKNIHFLMVRNTIKAVAESIYDEAHLVSEILGIANRFKFLKNPYRIICKSNGSRATAFGCMEGSSVASMTKGKKGIAEVTDAIIDELDEIPEYFFDLIDSRCRSPLSKTSNQIIGCYNPPIKTNWVPQRWFSGGKFMPEFVKPYTFDQFGWDHRNNKPVKNSTLVIRTSYLHNPHLPSDIAAVYENYKNTNNDLYLAGVLADWGNRFRGVYFSPKGYRECEVPEDLRGVIYCDPNLAKKEKGDTTAIVKLCTDNHFLYVKEVYVKNTTDSTELTNQILQMQNFNFRDIGFDGNAGQESMWSEIMRLSGYNQRVLSNIQYCRYKVDELVKTAQFLWDSGKIMFPKGFKDTIYGERFLEQIYSFEGKSNTRRGQHDDAPDALCCAIKFLFEKNLTHMRYFI
jgi:PBSX family phage terminase large subunit